MKFFSTLTLLTALVGGFSVSAVELSDATNSQLLAELDRRLHGTGGGGTGANANYLCDGSYRLQIELIGPTGDSKTESIYIGDGSYCEELATDMSRFKSRITSLQVVAVCDSSYRLRKYPLLANGTFGKQTEVYIGDQAKCRAQAKNINTSN